MAGGKGKAKAGSKAGIPDRRVASSTGLPAPGHKPASKPGSKPPAGKAPGRKVRVSGRSATRPAVPKAAAEGREGRVQYAALPFAAGPDGVRVLLITSRETRRWVIPKGWPMKGRKPHQAAAQEAYEEAGIVGKVGRVAIGSYEYDKRLRDGGVARVRVRVFPFEVARRKKRWPEKGERDQFWLTPSEAAAGVAEDGLRDILLGLEAPASGTDGLMAGEAGPAAAPAKEASVARRKSKAGGAKAAGTKDGKAKDGKAKGTRAKGRRVKAAGGAAAGKAAKPAASKAKAAGKRKGQAPKGKAADGMRHPSTMSP